MLFPENPSFKYAIIYETNRHNQGDQGSTMIDTDCRYNLILLEKRTLNLN